MRRRSGVWKKEDDWISEGTLELQQNSELR